jgi:hypothetical protein
MWVGAKAGFVMGALIGLMPLFIGLILRKPKAAIIGMVSCIVAGAIGGQYAIITVVSLSCADMFIPMQKRRKGSS